ncbi:MAG: class I SAM-dependent methyltransferase [Chloroflexi bacterium]|nr:class I SAM-dependent methyltransferase [Chloroflexota bacterium]
MTNLLKFISRFISRINNKLFGKKMLFILLSPFMPLLVKVFRHVAETGNGSELCLEQGCLPMLVHYYSPVPEIADLGRRYIWKEKSELPGVDFHPDRQVQILNSLGEQYGHECSWPPVSTGNPTDFFTENNSFSFGCAASLHSILRYYKPHKVLEIGSGNSSLIFSGALTQNALESHPSDYTVVDPYPSPLLQHILPCLTKVIPERVELMNIALFEDLKTNDVLFIDSGHTVRTGSDVNFLFLEVLPRLAHGVIVHIHDIGLPFEYPEVYFTNPSFRMFWTESYLLQAFLTFNSQYDVLLALNYLMSEKRQEFMLAFPKYDPSKHKAASGSFWMQRKLA